MKRSTSDLGSLELLLDTICNTFGGIIFLAILVGILLQISGNSTETAGPASDDPEKVARLEDELANVRQSVARQDEMIAAMGRPSTTGADDVENLQRQLAALEAQKAQERAKADEAIELRRQIASLEVQLKNEADGRTREARLPMLHKTTKSEIPVFVQSHRLSFLRNADASRSFNHDDFILNNLGTGKGSITPKVGSGIAVRPGEVPREEISTKIDAYDPAREYLAVFLWPDSFDVFADLRTLFVEQSFEYRLVPVPEEMKVLREGSGSSQVQ